jgi:hypothetical protein
VEPVWQYPANYGDQQSVHRSFGRISVSLMLISLDIQIAVANYLPAGLSSSSLCPP